MLKEIISEFINTSKETALIDGQITKDELELLDTFSSYLNKIDAELSDVLDFIDDDISLEDFKKRIKLILREVLPELTKVAQKDGIITSDESALISKILNEIN